MGKRKAGSQIGNLTSDHQKSGIDLFPMSDSKVRHGVEKLLRRATTLVSTSSWSDSAVGSYELPKFQDLNPGQFRDSNLEVPGKRAIWMWPWWWNTENTIWGKVVASPESGPWWVLCVKVPMASPNTQGCPRMLTNPLWLVFGCRFELDLLVHLPSLIPRLLARPSTPFQCWKLGAPLKSQLSATQHSWTLGGFNSGLGSASKWLLGYLKLLKSQGKLWLWTWVIFCIPLALGRKSLHLLKMKGLTWMQWFQH